MAALIWLDPWSATAAGLRALIALAPARPSHRSRRWRRSIPPTPRRADEPRPASAARSGSPPGARPPGAGGAGAAGRPAPATSPPPTSPTRQSRPPKPRRCRSSRRWRSPTRRRLRAGQRSSRLKWPNDPLIAGRKAAGILVESGPHPDGGLWLAVGCGVNLATPPENSERPATAFAEHMRAPAAEAAGGARDAGGRVRTLARALGAAGLRADRRSLDGARPWARRDLHRAAAGRDGERDRRGLGRRRRAQAPDALGLGAPDHRRRRLLRSWLEEMDHGKHGKHGNLLFEEETFRSPRRCLRSQPPTRNWFSRSGLPGSARHRVRRSPDPVSRLASLGGDL